MADHECQHATKIDELIKLMAENNILTKQVHTAVFGNGKPGLKTEIEQARGAMTIIKVMASSSIAIAVVSAAVSFIKRHV